MSILYETSEAVLAVIGVVALVWWSVGWFLRPRGRGVLCVLAKPADTREMEAAGSEVRWLRQWGADVRLCVLTDGLDEDGLRMAGLLLENDIAQAVCRMEELVAHGGGTAGGSDSFGYLWQ